MERRRFLKNAAIAGSNHREETWNRGEIGAAGQVANIALEHCQHVGLEPGVAACRGVAGDGRRIPACDHDLQQFFPRHRRAFAGLVA